MSREGKGVGKTGRLDGELLGLVVGLREGLSLMSRLLVGNDEGRLLGKLLEGKRLG